MKIIYEDNNQIIVWKPAGMLTQSGKSFDTDVVSAVLTYRRSKGEAAYAAVINRLDRPVSGLVLLAKTKQSAAALSAKLQKDTLGKQYYALICGKPDREKGKFVDYLKKELKTNVSAVVSEKMPGAKRAELTYEVIKQVAISEGEDSRDLTLVRVHLLTGRHHQIRVQFASRGLPLLGDTKYGGAYETQVREALLHAGKRIIQRFEVALCAYSLTVDERTYEIAVPWKID